MIKMIKPWIWKAFNWLNKYIAAPRMILGYKRQDGTFLATTRISNTVDIIQPRNLIIEDNVFIWHHTILECSNGVTIKEGCQIGANVLIASHSSHLSIRLYGKQYLKQSLPHLGYVRGKVEIGAYSFIGPHTTIMPNTIIGKGAIVAAYSLVKGEFPDFSIIAGNPAKIVGDTRKLDEPWLAQHSELKAYYEEWVKQC
jgi:acetyltransferase-like isoleucine patch superfamily enzyme